MKVIKPNRLGVVTRCFEHERRFHFAVSVLAFVPLAEEAPLLSEVSLWKLVAERMGPQAMLEPGVPKSRGEFLVHGRCFAPGGVPHPQVPVHAQLGEVTKAAMVYGDRYWKPDRKPSEPQPFTELELHWSRAFGGPKFPRNPLGRGHGESEYLGQRVQLLPNIESPEALVLAPRDKPEPVGFGAVDIAWPQRRSLAGTYDKRWLETLFPGMAHDIDWRMFNLAQPDQQREGFWESRARYRFDNLHPQRPCLEGELPPIVGRAFITRKPPPRESEAEPEASPPGELGLEEVELALRTLWFFPDAERAVMIFQGSVRIDTDDGTDLRHLVLAAEDLDQPRPAEHYAQALQDRLDPERGVVASLRDHELLPAAGAGFVDEDTLRERALHDGDRLLEHNLHRRAVREHAKVVQRLRAEGLDPDEYGPPPPEPPAPPPSIEELPDMVVQLQAEAEAKQAQEAERMEQRRERMRAALEAQGVEEAERERLLRQHEQGPTGPPRFTAAGQRASAEALLQQARAQGADVSALEQMLADPRLQARWELAETQLRDNYRKTAHLQDPAPALSAQRSEDAKACVRQSVEAGVDFSTLDLTGADLSGMSLRGADLSGAFLESARLDGADLRQADLRGAVLAHASLEGARLDEARLDGANLGRACLRRASLHGASLRGTELMGADLTEAVLRGADLREASLLQVVLTRADASEIVTEQLMLVEAQTQGLVLAGSRLPKASFVRLDLEGASLLGARLPQATFVGCTLGGVSFAGATLDGARFVEQCRLDEASFAGATLRRANLRGSSLRGASFDQAQLDEADLCETRLAGASFYRAVARGTRFDKADLRDASMVAANLLRASLLGATIHGLDLRGANLYGADMARVRTDERVRLEEANLGKVRIHPVHERKGAS